MTNPDNVGGLPELAAQWDESAKRLVKTGVEYDNGKAAALHHCAAAIRRLCRAAPAGGEPVMYQQIHRHHPDAKWEECSKAIFDQYTEYHRKYGGVPPVRALYER